MISSGAALSLLSFSKMALSTAPLPLPPSLLSSTTKSPSTAAITTTATTTIGVPLRCVHRSAILTSRRSFPPFLLCSALQEAATAVGEDEVSDAAADGEIGNQITKLYVANFPWTFTASEVQNLFGECGTVKDVDIIAHKNGKSRGFAFVSMDSPEAARAVIDKFDSYELLGRIIRVEYAKNLKKPTPAPPPAETIIQEKRNLIYASNLAWKVRSSNLRDFFSTNFKPMSARVVFDSPSGRSAGYGFVSFATEEEAEAAVSEMNGKELMGRPLLLKISEKNIAESGNESRNTNDVEAEVSQSTT